MKSNKRRQLAISGFFLVLSFNFSFIQFANADSKTNTDSIASMLSENATIKEKKEMSSAIVQAEEELRKCKAQKTTAECAEVKARLDNLNRQFNMIFPGGLDKTPGSYSQDYQDLSEDLEGKQQQWQSDCQWKTKYSSTAEEKKCKGLLKDIVALEKKVNRIAKKAGEDSPSDLKKENCDDLSKEYADEMKECNAKCIEKMQHCNETDDDWMNQDLQQTFQMVGAFNEYAGMAATLTSKPDCTLSKEDFKEEKTNMKEDLSKAQEELNKLKSDELEAQKNYAEKINTLNEKEAGIREEIDGMPSKLEKSKRDLLKAKEDALAKLQSAVTSLDAQIRKAKTDYNGMVSSKNLGLRKYSMIKIQEECLKLIDGRLTSGGAKDVGRDQKNQQIINQYNNSLSGAFKNGKAISLKNDAIYKECVSDKQAEGIEVAKQTVDQIKSQGESIKEMEKQYATISSEQQKAQDDYSFELKSLLVSDAATYSKLIQQYQNVQNEKAQAKTLLDQEIANNQKQQKELSTKIQMLNMKQMMFTMRTAPTTSGKNYYQNYNSYQSLKGRAESIKTMCCTATYSSSFCDAFKGDKVKKLKTTKASDKGSAESDSGK